MPPGVLAMLGDAALASSDLASAEEAANKALAIDAMFPAGHRILAEVYLRRSDRGKARGSIARALALYPASQRAWQVAEAIAGREIIRAVTVPQPFIEVNNAGAVVVVSCDKPLCERYAACKAAMRHEPPFRQAVLNEQPEVPYHLSATEEIVCLQAGIGAHLRARSDPSAPPEPDPTAELLWRLAQEKGLTSYAMFEILGRNRPEWLRVAPRALHEIITSYVLERVLANPSPSSPAQPGTAVITAGRSQLRRSRSSMMKRARLLACICGAAGAIASTGVQAQEASPPAPAPAPDPRDESLLRACGEGDARLHDAAVEVAQRSSRGRGVPDMHELSAMLRAQGDPHVRPRAWTLRAKAVDRGDALTRMNAWLTGMRAVGVRRCGVASIVDSERGESIAVVEADVAADLAVAVPREVRQGAWVTVDARALVSSSEAKLIVLGPRGAPRTIPTSFDRSSGRVLGRFMADVPGRWVVQLLLTTANGPQPTLEAAIEAGSGARVAPSGRDAPGEHAADGQRDDGVAVTVMLNAARKTEGLGSLVRDVRLDAVAERHVRAMIRSGVMAHEAGDGTPVTRLEGAGLSPRELGENVAHAPSPALAHRVLWDSPSHRGNMLHGRFKRVGVAAARDGSGSVWVTQIFAGVEEREADDEEL